jgi:hypothetical protein
MAKNIALAFMAIALISLGGFEGFRYWKQHERPANDWQVNSQYNGVRGTSNTMLVKRADGYAEAVIQIPEFLMVCPDNAPPFLLCFSGFSLGISTKAVVTCNRRPSSVLPPGGGVGSLRPRCAIWDSA